jgi:hypothetical protein
MLKLARAEDGEYVLVTFQVPPTEVGAVSVVGDFNDWDPSATPLRASAEGYTASVRVRPGRYRFRYLAAGGFWFNDEAAHDLVDNGHGGTDSVVDTAPAASSWVTGETDVEHDDAVGFLIGQHVAIRELFNEVANAQGQVRTTAFEQLVRLLAVHETAEQQVLRPVTRAAIQDGEAIAEARIAEEREAKEMLVELEKIGPDGAEFADLLGRLRAAVLSHARSEETEEFPYLRLQGQTGEPMIAMIRTSEAIAPTHPHPSVNSATAHTLTGPVISMFDRARDLFRKAFHN